MAARRTSNRLASTRQLGGMLFTVVLLASHTVAYAQWPPYMGDAQWILDSKEWRSCYSSADEEWIRGGEKDFRKFNREYAGCLDRLLKQHDTQHPGRYAVIVRGYTLADESVGGVSWNYRNLTSATVAAEEACERAKGPLKWCKLRYYTRNGCIAYAEGYGTYGYASAASEIEAKRKTLEDCGEAGSDCRIMWSKCVSKN